MIHNLLPTIGAELNEYFKSKFEIEEDRVIVSNLINQDGSIAVEGNNKVVFHLVNIEEETTLKSSSGTSSFGGGFGASGGNINVNLTVMFSAFFSCIPFTITSTRALISKLLSSFIRMLLISFQK